ncbi:winged helix-turn-helix transcriptional regulator [Aneurinibacillus sp. BA2021]|jgi:DNA-binding transcriptional ArsR family regulator|uniref:ArsR/SmtB family transcription factor n=1 Tax=Brevibacillus borstelensis TaxID=45462 RepID=UPI001981F607|nr:metalloregulator ArsR/SmtB family transcription factor [Brevibacillus borstelensis]MBN6189195.1 winged helix-turn-helix transcriptional regulator [Aneurinibacillus sp. BA2021]MBN6192930.1 winged helix-turn-helix transcriptional regulator [Aneurinibacillus sp. BA2021]MCC0566635.1 metalloregulator ArsR/SmtB family transcription factor [Brevibacillus borstelensis]MCM3561395.1 metalloregulator ArsR/SmtB family transcription factor [Brevibacillus borstelensis]MCM3593009.1 metalloregulator ArsR/S
MKEKDTCEIYCFDESKVRRVQILLQNQDIQRMATMFKALADETRMKITFALCQEDEMCVCDVANIIGSSMATASHHLRTLHQLGLAKYRKEGKLVFYSLEDQHVRQLVQIASTHSQEMVTNGK